MKEIKYKFKKLHLTVPEELFLEIRNKGLFPKIDEICIELLEQYLSKSVRLEGGDL